MTKSYNGAGGQAGFVLITTLVLLVMVTIIVVAAFRLGNANTLIIANAQFRNEALDAAQQAIDVVINSSGFATNPAAAIPQSNCPGGGANSWCVDANGRGNTDITVALSPQPTCIAAQPIPVSQLDLTKQEDLACVSGVQQNFGQGGGSAVSMCANSTWRITAVATDSFTGASMTVISGVNVRIPTSAMTTYCP